MFPLEVGVHTVYFFFFFDVCITFTYGARATPCGQM